MLRKAVGSILALLLFTCITMGSVSGASITGGNGIRLSPIRFDLQIDPGKSKTIQFNVQNITKDTATYEAVVNNFTANNQNGSPQLLTNNKYDPTGIKQFISKIPSITVKPKQTVQVKVDINIPKGTAGGGYFGAIRFLAVNPSTGKTVNISASVAGLILLTVPGPGLHEGLSLKSFNVGQNGQNSSLFYSNKGINVYASFNNTGNVQVPPFGKIVVQNMSGDTIETKAINNTNPPGNVLPASSRTFNVPLTGIGSIFGKYKVSGYFGYGNKGTLLSATTTFYVVSPWLIGLAVVIIVLIIVGVFFAPRIFRAWYKRSIKKVKVNN